jgi:hypothetical protein
MIALASFMALATAGFQGGDGTPVLQKIEDRLSSAKSLDICFRFVLEEVREQTSQRLSGPGRASVQDGGKIRLTLTFPKGAKDETFEIVSDGKRTAWRSGEPWNPPADTPAHFATNLRVVWSRVGCGGPPTADMAPWLLAAQSGKPDAADKCKIGNVRTGGHAATPLLTYTIDEPGLESGKAECTLWYDPKTFSPKKRLIRFKSEKSEGSYEESYDKVAVDGEMPPDHFELPRKK